MPIDPQSILPSAAVLKLIGDPDVTSPLDIAAKRQKLLAGQMDIEEARRKVADEQASNAALQSPTLITKDKDGNPAFDLEGVQKLLTTRNAGHLFPAVAEKLGTISKTYADIRESQAKAQKAQQAVDEGQKLAYGTQGIFVQDAGYDPGAYNLMLDYGKAHGQLTDDQVTSMKAQVAAAPDPKAFIKTQVDQALADPGVKKLLQAQQRINIKQQQADTGAAVGAATVAGKEEKTLQDAKANVAQELQAAFKQGPEAYQQRLNEIKADTTNKTWAIAARSMPPNPTSVQDIRRGGGLTEAQQEQAAQADVKAQLQRDLGEQRLTLQRQKAAQIGANKTAALAGDPIAGGEALSPEAKSGLADVFARTFEVPSMGWGTAGKVIKMQVINEAYRKYPNLDPSVNKAQFKSLTGSLNQLQKTYSTSEAFSDKYARDLDVFFDEAKNMGLDSGVPIANRPWRSFANKVLGDKGVAGFNVSRKTTLDEFNRIVSTAGLGGAPLSDASRAAVSKLLDDDATMEQYQHAVEVMKKEVANRSGAYKDRIDATLNQIDAILPKHHGAGSPLATPGTAPAAAAPAAAAPAGGAKSADELRKLLFGK